MSRPVTVVQAYDWTWLLKVPVAAGEPIPMEILFLWHANTLQPLKALGLIDGNQ